MLRRPFLASALALAWPVALARRVPREPLMVGVDRALFDSGLARRLHEAFSLDTGIGVELVPAPVLAVLDAVRDGEIDAAIANAPAAEQVLEAQSLVHDRRPIAVGEYVLVGPLPAPRGRNAGPALGSIGAEALTAIHRLATASPDRLLFLSANDGSGAHLAEQALWRAARLAPAAPWYAAAGDPAAFYGQIQARGAFALVERGAWAARGGGGRVGIVCSGDAALAEPVHAMRSFRALHPAGRIFVSWIAGGRGHAIVAANRAYRPPPP